MSQASDLLAQIQETHTAQFPATIRVADQSYSCGTSGLSRQLDLAELGGPIARRKITFFLPSTAFDDAGQAIPDAPMEVECTAPAAYAGIYHIETAIPGPGGNVLILHCIEPPQ